MENRDIKNILQQAKTIAVVGASQKPWRDSNSIMQFLIDMGYMVFPVNPVYTEVLGRTCYASLKDIPEPIDIVDIFRNSEFVIPIVHDAIAARTKTVWMQLGVVNETAAKLAHDAGLSVIMDKCIAVEYRLHVRR